MKTTKRTMYVIAATAGLAGCFSGPGFFSQKNVDAGTTSLVGATTSGGVTSGSVSAQASTTQVLKGEGNVSLSIPPGTLATNAVLSIQEGSGLAGDSFSVELGLGDTSVSAASSDMVVSSSVAQDPLQPFSLQIPVSSSGLALTTKYLVVIYKIQKFSEGGQYVVGMMPHSSVTVTAGVASFAAKFWGSYQLAYVDKPVTAEKTKNTSTKIVTKNEKELLDKTSPLAWKDEAISLDAASRTASLSMTLSGASAITGCAGVIDDDKVAPFLSRSPLTKPSFTFTPLKGTEHKVYVRISCLGDGRPMVSSWHEMTFPGLIPSVSGAPAGSIDAGTTVSLTVTGTGLKAFRYAETTDCNSASYSADQQIGGSITITNTSAGTVGVCILGVGPHGFNGSPTLVSWSQSAPASEIPFAFDSANSAAAPILGRVVAEGAGAYTLSGTCEPSNGPVTLNPDPFKSGFEPGPDPCTNGTFSFEISHTNGAGAIKLDGPDAGKYIEAKQGGNSVWTWLFSQRTGQTIYIANDWTNLKTLINTHLMDSNSMIVLGADIDGGNETIAPFGLNSNMCMNSASMTLEGNGKIIQDVNVSIGSTTSPYPAGFFCSLGDYGVISNIYLVNYTMNNTTNNAAVGGLVGSLNCTSGECAIINSTVTGTVTSDTSEVGGLVGQLAYGDIYSSHFDGNVSSPSGSMVGGLVGYVSGGTTSIIGGSTKGMVTGQSATGGFVGKSIGTILLGYSEAAVSTTGGYAGGFIGWQDGGLIEDSFAGGAVTSTMASGGAYIGGFAGMVKYTINRCHSSGLVTLTTTSATTVGGFAGYMYLGNAKINDSYTTSNISAPSAGFVGGFVGRMGQTNDTAIQNSYSAGQIASGTQPGGFVGKLENGTGTLSAIKNSFTVSTFTNGPTSPGGFTGYAPATTASLDIDNSFWSNTESNCYTGNSCPGVGQITDITTLYGNAHGVYGPWNKTTVWAMDPTGLPVLQMPQ